MSTFDGRIEDIPFIRIDHFGADSYVEAYFLSHCHTDHMASLTGRHVNRFPIFCSFESSALLNGLAKKSQVKLQHILPCLKPLSLGTHTLQIGRNTLKCTVLDANHIIGSVMFLFEYRNKKFLYTGDVRAETDWMKNLRLHGHIDALLLDTTFCHPDFLSFPSREEASNACLEIIEKYPKNFPVFIEGKANFGYEPIWITIHDHFNTPVHIDPQLYHAYVALADKIPAFKTLVDAVTLDPSSTRFHSCHGKPSFRRFAHMPCCPEAGSQFLYIKTTAFWYVRSEEYGSLSYISDGPNRYRVAYSMHSSFSELRSFVKFVSPKTISPNVLAKDEVGQYCHEVIKYFGNLVLRESNKINICHTQAPAVEKVKPAKSSSKKTTRKRRRLEYYKTFKQDQYPGLQCIKRF